MIRFLLACTASGLVGSALAATDCKDVDVPTGVAGSCAPTGIPICELTGTRLDCEVGADGGGGPATAYAVNYTTTAVTVWGQTAGGAAFCCVEPLSSIDRVEVHGASDADVLALTYAGFELKGSPTYPISGAAYGKVGADTITGSAARVLDGYTAESLYGDIGDDVIEGREGNDGIWGDGGDDLIWGNEGIDDLYGGDGNDTIRGGDGDDYVEGNDGNDRINAGDGSDEAHGDLGDDLVCTDKGKGELLFGEYGFDILDDPDATTAVGDGGPHPFGSVDRCSRKTAPWSNCEIQTTGPQNCPTP